MNDLEPKKDNFLKKILKIISDNTFVFFIVILVLLFISGLLIGFISGYYYKHNNNNNTNQETAKTTTDSLLKTPNVSLEKMTQQKGTIIKKEDSKLIINGKVVENNELVAKDFTVLLNGETKYKRINLNSDENRESDISLNDLKEGDIITAYSLNEEDFKGKTEFTAGRINFYVNE